VLRPQPTAFGADAYQDVHSKAAALLHSLVNNHPFIDGNKRTAVLAMIVFYEPIRSRWSPWPSIPPRDRFDVEAIAATLKGWARSANTE